MLPGGVIERMCLIEVRKVDECVFARGYKYTSVEDRSQAMSILLVRIGLIMYASR